MRIKKSWAGLECGECDQVVARRCNEAPHPTIPDNPRIRASTNDTGNCDGCGEPMIQVNVRMETDLHCSDECRAKHREDQIQKVIADKKAAKYERLRRYRNHQPHNIKCGQCGNEFVSKRSDARFCGARCRVAFNRRIKHESKAT